MTSALCGIPLVGAGASNSMGGMDRFMPRATCLGDLLAPQGYRLEHIIGSDLAFAGWGKFFSDHGFQRVEGFAALDASLPKDTPLSPWGLHDETLLSIAVDHIKALEKADRPFGFVLNTLDTHHPSGHPGPACAKVPYQEGNSSLLDSFHCLDHLVGDFVAKLKAAGVFKNTVLIISSDHLSMPNDVYDRLKKHVRHDFVMAYGAGVPAAVNETKGSALDTGVTLLNLIGYDVPALGLGRDLLPKSMPPPGRIADIEAAIRGSVGYLTSLWAFPNLEAPMIADVGAGKLELGTRSVSLPALFLFDDRNSVQAVYFAFYGDTPLSERVPTLGSGRHFLWIDHCATVATLFSGLDGGTKDLCAVYGRKGTPDLQGITISGRQELDLAKLKSALDWKPETVAPGARLLTVLQTSAPAPSSVDIVSAGFGAGTSFVSLNGSGDKLVLRRGLSVVGLAASGTPTLIDHADTCAYETPKDALPPLDFPLATIIHDNRAKFAALAVVAYDSANCDRYDLGPVFDGTDLVRGKEIAFRTPYIALLKADGAITEMSGAPETTIHLDTPIGSLDGQTH